MINQVNKNWGSEDWLVNNEKYCAKFLNLNHGYQCSVHYHACKDETFYVLAGEVELYVVELLPYSRIYPLEQAEIDEWYKEILTRKEEILASMQKIVLTHGQQYRLKPFTAHKFTSITSGAKILEISTTHYEEDSYRLTESGKV
jgi:D-lyxose ketol-isomerase